MYIRCKCPVGIGTRTIRATRDIHELMRTAYGTHGAHRNTLGTNTYKNKQSYMCETTCNTGQIELRSLTIRYFLRAALYDKREQSIDNLL